MRMKNFPLHRRRRPPLSCIQKLKNNLPETLLSGVNPGSFYGRPRGWCTKRGGARRRRRLAGLAVWSAVNYSAAPHKEFRFLLPALQLMAPHCGAALAHLASRPAGPAPQPGTDMVQSGSSTAQPGTNPRQPGTAVTRRRGPRRQCSTSAVDAGRARQQQSSGVGKLLAAALACVALQLPAALYFSLRHQR